MAYHEKRNTITSKTAAWFDRLGERVAGLGRNLTVKEGLVLSNSDYEVEAVPATHFFNGQLIEIPNAQVIRRADTGHVFAVMKDRYAIVQNAEALALADVLVGAGGFNIESCGNMYNGAKVFATLRAENGNYEIGGREHNTFVSVLTSHDGVFNLYGGLTDFCVVCENTFNIALAGMKADQSKDSNGEKSFRFRHTTNVKKRMEEFAEAAEFIAKHTNDIKERMQYMATRKMSSAAIASFFNEVLEITQIENEKVSTQKKNARLLLDEILETNVNEIGANARFTAYDVFNAVSYMTDHESKGKRTNGKTAEEAQAWSTVFGSGQTLKTRAMEILNADGSIREVTNSELLNAMIA